MSKKLAIVAVESNLVGRRAIPAWPADGPLNHLWPFKNGDPIHSSQYPVVYTSPDAEIVAVYVGDLDEGGALKYVLRASGTGELATVYERAFAVPGMVE